MRRNTWVVWLLCACDESTTQACCAACGAADVCVVCPSVFAVCVAGPFQDCVGRTGASLCECLMRERERPEGWATCDVVDGVARVTYSPAFCAWVAEHEAPVNACQ